MLELFVFSWALTVGYVPQQVNAIKDTYVMIDEAKTATVTDIQLSVMAFDHLRVSTDIETFQYFSDAGGFAPYRADYSISADWFFSDNVMVGMSHECDHPIASNFDYHGIQSAYEFAGTETQVYVRIGSALR